eukprot:TRINITY_DN34043_c0_g1_i3.p1 TRINITY_DN34043_c0_g1~~TRINITY_DN34043_c0_g1_i3.p1  ORF type:complete len:435 (+),score=59.74 TRINITY_DN34043_c0_g1_i3:89-1393(+)
MSVLVVSPHWPRPGRALPHAAPRHCHPLARPAVRAQAGGAPARHQLLVRSPESSASPRPLADCGSSGAAEWPPRLWAQRPALQGRQQAPARSPERRRSSAATSNGRCSERQRSSAAVSAERVRSSGGLREDPRTPSGDGGLLSSGGTPPRRIPEGMGCPPGAVPPPAAGGGAPPRKPLSMRIAPPGPLVTVMSSASEFLDPADVTTASPLSSPAATPTRPPRRSSPRSPHKVGRSPRRNTFRPAGFLIAAELSNARRMSSSGIQEVSTECSSRRSSGPERFKTCPMKAVMPPPPPPDFVAELLGPCGNTEQTEGGLGPREKTMPQQLPRDAFSTMRSSEEDWEAEVDLPDFAMYSMNQPSTKSTRNPPGAPGAAGPAEAAAPAPQRTGTGGRCLRLDTLHTPLSKRGTVQFGGHSVSFIEVGNPPEPDPLDGLL